MIPLYSLGTGAATTVMGPLNSAGVRLLSSMRVLDSSRGLFVWPTQIARSLTQALLFLTSLRMRNLFVKLVLCSVVYRWLSLVRLRTKQTPRKFRVTQRPHLEDVVGPVTSGNVTDAGVTGRLFVSDMIRAPGMLRLQELYSRRKCIPLEILSTRLRGGSGYMMPLGSVLRTPLMSLMWLLAPVTMTIPPFVLCVVTLWTVVLTSLWLPLGMTRTCMKCDPPTMETVLTLTMMSVILNVLQNLWVSEQADTLLLRTMGRTLLSPTRKLT